MLVTASSWDQEYWGASLSSWRGFHKAPDRGGAWTHPHTVPSSVSPPTSAPSPQLPPLHTDTGTLGYHPLPAYLPHSFLS